MEAFAAPPSTLALVPEKTIDKHIHPTANSINPLRSQDVPTVSLCTTWVDLAMILSSSSSYSSDIALIGT